MDWVLAVLLGLGAYLLGSTPSAYILVYQVKGVDIRRVGSRNVGALNTLHQMGLCGSLLILLVDAGKGALAVLIPGWVGAPDWTLYLTAILVVVGHNWPVFLGFHGGKGAASVLGISLTMLPVLTLIAVAPSIVVILLTRNALTGMVLGFILLNTLTVATSQDLGQVALCLLLTFMVAGTYLAATWEQTNAAIRDRDWRLLLHGTGLKR